MKMDVTSLRLDEVSEIVRKMERFGYVSRIEHTADQFMLIFDTMGRPQPSPQVPQRIWNWQ